MAGGVPRVEWRCAICPKVELRMPSRAHVRTCYGCRGAYLARFGNVGNRRAAENRIRRVMLVKGYTRAEALIYVAGWRDGYPAGRNAAKRALRVGSAQWE